MTDDDIISLERDGSYWLMCGRCGGDGEIENECVCSGFEDVCYCLDPEPRPCPDCAGQGALHVKGGRPVPRPSERGAA